MTETLSLPLPGSRLWDEALDSLGSADPARRPLLFPQHFLRATFPAMGGRIVVARIDDREQAVGLLFPDGAARGHRKYLLRLTPGHPLACGAETLRRQAEQALAPCQVTVYDPTADHEYTESHHLVGDFDIGTPSKTDAAAIRSLQREIWQGGEETLYPADIHSAAFSAATSLVARRGGHVVAFLFGFCRFDTYPPDDSDSGNLLASVPPPESGVEAGLESQLLGVHPSLRRSGLGRLLKIRQALQAQRQGIRSIHWTADPLQFPNAVLNYSRLGAAAGSFYPDYYPVRNGLNRVKASRFGVTWLLNSCRVREVLAGAQKEERSQVVQTGRLSDGGESVTLNSSRDPQAGKLEAPVIEPSTDPVTAPIIAIEIPADWTALQQESPAAAAAWRDRTDALFARLIGWEPGRYVVIDTAAEAGRCYLVARRSADVLANLERD